MERLDDHVWATVSTHVAACLLKTLCKSRDRKFTAARAEIASEAMNNFHCNVQMAVLGALDSPLKRDIEAALQELKNAQPDPKDIA